MEAMQTIDKYDTDLKFVKKIAINKNIERVYHEAFSVIAKAGIPSFILLILSFFVGVSDVPIIGNLFESMSKVINPDHQVLNTDIQPVDLLVVSVYHLFNFHIKCIKSECIIKKRI